jgi:VWFA-related protein
MKTPKNLFAHSLVLALFLFVSALTVFGQQQPPQDKTDDVVRISTELVQTGVTVLDKQGHFVDGLKPEQFVLKVDGQPVTPSFFERVTAGTAREEKLVTAAAGGAAPQAAPASEATVRGRTIVFFIDDLHLSPESVGRTRKTILDFVENQMSPYDQVAVASASNQIGFLQQFTDLKAVLRAAVARLNHIPYTVRDVEVVPMTEYTALRIDQGDRDATDHYTTELLKSTNYRGGSTSGGKPVSPFGGRSPQGETGGMTREQAERVVKERAQVMLKQAASVSLNTLNTLESLMRSSSTLPGRKLVFFISDGFYLNDRNTGFNDKLRQITDAAARAGVVIYSIDARGIVSMTDASSNRADPNGRLSRSDTGELSASQDPLTALAADTGGRALLNSDGISSAVTNALQETSNYYLLAWRPPTDEQKGAKFKRVEVSIAGRPDLTVRLPKGFVAGRTEADAAKAAKESKTPAANASTPAAASNTAGAAKGPEGDIKSALTATAPKKGLPTQLSVGYLDVPGTGTVLTASVQMATDVLGYGDDGKQPAAIDLAGMALNDQGKPVGSFKTRLNVNPLAENVSVERPVVVYNNKVPLKPGLYQVRVAARDDKTGRVGSATQWIEIPDLAQKRLTLSSLMVGGQFVGKRKDAGPAATAAAAPEQVQFSVDRRFKAGSHMNFLTIAYNATPGPGGSPDLEAQIKITRDGQAVVNAPARKIGTPQGTDLARVPYGADIGLSTLSPGRYVLQVTINDRAAKTSAMQQTTFDIE